MRIQLSMRCPSIQFCEKTSPLHIQELCWTKTSLKINETYYKTTKAIWKAKESSQEYVLLGLEIGGSTERAVFNTTFGEVMNYILKQMLGGRQVIATHTCIGMDTDAFQNGRNLVTDTLEIYTGDLRKTLDTLSSIFHPSSFPLKSLRILDNADFKHPIIQGSLLLVVPNTENMHLISNKRVHARYFYYKDDVDFIINKWLDDGKEAGTHFSIGMFLTEDHVKEKYEEFLSTFEERVSWR